MLRNGTRKSKNGTAKVETFAYGIYALYARHHAIRKLKHLIRQRIMASGFGRQAGY